MGLFLKLWDLLVDLVEVGEEELLTVLELYVILLEFGRDTQELLLEQVVFLAQLWQLKL